MGSIYFIQAVTGGPVKIGYSADVPTRVRELQTSSPVRLAVLCTVEGTMAGERALHNAFATDSMEGEWFTPSDALRSKVKELGGEVLEARAWTPEDRAAPKPRLCRGGTAVQLKLDILGKTQGWLVEQINALRAERGVKGRVGMATIWRWMSGFSTIGIDDALVLQRILGVPVATWSKYEDVEPATT
jgi:hypothetical protein